MKLLPWLGELGGVFVAALIPLYALAYLVYFIIGLPLRRQERARFFLDLVSTGLDKGDSIEQTVVSVSHSQDTSVGVRFHLLAAYLERGWNLGAALEKVGGFLPPQLTAMLKVGEEVGDPRRVLPACRALLHDATSHIQSAYNYLIVLAFVLIPIIPAIFWVMSVFVLPKYQLLFADLSEEGNVLPVMPFTLAAVLSRIQIVLALAFYVGAIAYMGGPRLLSWLTAGLSIPTLGNIGYRIPWRRKRMQRNFAAMLAVLLDAGVPEPRAVSLAAESTANRTFMRRADGVVAKLGEGASLPDALGKLDETGEFRWRLTNALHSGKHFFAALEGWLESLEARAFRQQQAFAQVLTTALVLYNGLMVSLFAVFVFRGFVMIINEGLLW
jgi:type II secretory pathway component PulF